MTAQEIFRLPAIDFIEAEICNLYWQYEQHCYYNKAEKEAIKQLLAVRKRLLDKEFVMDDHYKQLLNDFNKAMTDQLLQMRRIAHAREHEQARGFQRARAKNHFFAHSHAL